jgi:diacylglycerol kinase (ATP)
MSRHFGTARLIVNPRAGKGGVGDALPTLTSELAANGVDVDVVETKDTGHATELARQALDEGVRYLIAAGGDGTVGDVVNGMFEGGAPVAPDAVLAVASHGTGCDFVRNFGLDRKPAMLARHLATEHTMDIDVGCVRYLDDTGAPAERLFVNLAQVGYGAEVARIGRRMPRGLGRVGSLLTAWASIRAVDRTEAAVRVAQGERMLTLVNLIVANGQWFQDGIKVAPRALPDDDRFNVLAFTGERSQVFVMTIPMFKGEHLPNPNIAEWQSKTAEVSPVEPMHVEADSVYLGRTPAEFTLLHRVLRMKI